ncbi:ATP-binding protein [Flavobacterium lipolyticum]|uniref:AAA family ATPase n=1 Tax=Flavobacterium lipolyticum TaxID=2893754 RepID=A0ABS8LWP4_9FLAO|nr:AAA family ATPase [Flavobacterium sp. F-126]MCC9016968.1 AAA family ATPase [Flavobacterium sp. F-126]
MKTIEIKGLVINNFKGIKNLSVNFKKNTDVFGANGTGKSTIYDAFLWLLFNKNAEEKKDFSIKNTIDTTLNRQDHEVEGLFVINGDPVALKKVYKEKWQKKKGSEVAEYTGNETVYFWNEVPMQQKEFQGKVSNIMDEVIFKLITNPFALNLMKWQDRRGIITQMAGEFTDEQIAAGNPEYEKLLANLTQDKTMSEYLKQIKASVDKQKKELKEIPTRIDEISKTKPQGFDFQNLKNLLTAKQNLLNNKEELISNKSEALNAVLESNETAKRTASNLKSEISQIETETRSKANNSNKVDTSVLTGLESSLTAKKGELSTANSALVTVNGLITSKKSDIEALEIKMKAKRADWTTENAKELTFEEDSFCCPTCQRAFEESDIESKKSEMITKFQNDKAINLAEINRQGGLLKTEKENLESELETLKTRSSNGEILITNLKSEVETIETNLAAEKAKTNDVVPVDIEEVYNNLLLENTVYTDKRTELQNVEAKIQEEPKVDDAQLKEEKRVLLEEMEEIKVNLRNEEQIKAVDDRINQLKEKETELAQEIANVEKTQFLIEQFEKDKMSAIEANVNSKFRIVKFKMFEDQVNGGESPACEILVNGVPFSDTNTASRINAGIDIISTLSKFYQVSAPIFIDGAESIHDILSTDSQLIRLVVSKSDKSLRVA